VNGTGAFNNAVTWTASAGSVSTAGILTAPATAQTVTATATSVQDTTKSGTTTVVVTAPPPPPPIDLGVGQNPVMAVDVNGNVDLAWDSSNGLFFGQSTDQGNTVEYHNIVPGPVSGVELGLDGHGDINLLWVEQSGTISNTIFGNSIDGGKTFLQTSTARYGDLSVSANGTIDTVYLVRGVELDSTILINRGQEADPPVEVASDHKDLVEGAPPINAAGPQGQIYVAWEEGTGEFTAECAIMFSRSLDGGMTFSTPLNVSNNPNECAEFPYLFVDSTGAVNLAWTTISGFQDDNGPLVNPNELYFARSTDQGTTFSTPVALVGINQYTGVGDDFSGVGDPQIAVESNGAIDVVFDANTTTDTIALFARSTDGGTTFSTPLTLATGGANSPTIAIDSCGGIDVAYAGASDIFFSRSTDGVTFAPATNLSNARKSEFGPLIATGVKGSAYIVWEDSTNIFFQLVKVCP
jgi:BNR repeat-like domain